MPFSDWRLEGYIYSLTVANRLNFLLKPAFENTDKHLCSSVVVVYSLGWTMYFLEICLLFWELCCRNRMFCSTFFDKTGCFKKLHNIWKLHTRKTVSTSIYIVLLCHRTLWNIIGNDCMGIIYRSCYNSQFTKQISQSSLPAAKLLIILLKSGA